MMVIRLCLAIIMITMLPMAVGTIFRPLRLRGRGILFAWICGQVCLWATFLLICVPMILADAKFSQVKILYFASCGILLAFAGILALARRKKATDVGTQGKMPREKKDKATILFWGIFATFLLLQVFCVFFLAYEDGDDAYYVAIASYAKEVGSMYRNIPYTGAYGGLNFRHSLAPFPIWVAVLADVAGLSVAVTAHVMMPILILFMTYGLYGLLGESLIGEEKKSWVLPLFMSFVALLVTFGGYSIYSAENFLIVRAGQGKAVLANVVIPALLYFMALLLRRLEEREKTPVSLWVLLCATMTTGCLCSTLGTFLLCVLVGAVTVCAVVAYRRWKILFGVVLAMLMPAVMASLYVVLG